MAVTMLGSEPQGRDGLYRLAAGRLESHGTEANGCVFPALSAEDGRGFDQPEKRLMVAVLNDAIRLFFAHTGVPSRTSRKIVLELEDWFYREEFHWPFSFLNICQHLQLEPSSVRGVLARRSRAVPAREDGRLAYEAARLGRRSTFNSWPL